MGIVDKLSGGKKQQKEQSFDPVEYMKKEVNSDEPQGQLGKGEKLDANHNDMLISYSKGAPTPTESKGEMPSMDLPPPPPLQKPPEGTTPQPPSYRDGSIGQSFPPPSGAPGHTASSIPSDVDHQDFSIKPKHEQQPSAPLQVSQPTPSQGGMADSHTQETGKPAGQRGDLTAGLREKLGLGPSGNQPAKQERPRERSFQDMQKDNAQNTNEGAFPGPQRPGQNAGSTVQAFQDKQDFSQQNSKPSFFQQQAPFPSPKQPSSMRPVQPQQSWSGRDFSESSTQHTTPPPEYFQQIQYEGAPVSEKRAENTMAGKPVSSKPVQQSFSEAQQQSISQENFDEHSVSPVQPAYPENEEDIFITVADLRKLVDIVSAAESEVKVASDSVSRTDEITGDTESLFENLREQLEAVQECVDKFDRIMFSQ
ncbi:MAG: hypothetical protein ACOCQX_02980 [Candidatus Nanoarchaeia archaeon]